MVTLSCLGFLSELVPTSTSLALSLTASSASKQAHLRAWYCFSCLSENCILRFDGTYICGHLCVTSLQFCISSPNPTVLFSGVGVSWWMSPSASWALGVFSCQAVYRSELLFVVSSTSCSCAQYVVYTRLIRTLITVCSASLHLLLV